MSARSYYEVGERGGAEGVEAAAAAALGLSSPAGAESPLTPGPGRARQMLLATS